MGCELGKFAKSTRQNEDQDLNKPSNQQSDPRLPLTAKQKYSMIASWKGIARAMGPTGVYMFIKYVFFLFFFTTSLRSLYIS